MNHDQATRDPVRRDLVQVIPANRSHLKFIENLSRQVFRRYGPYDQTLVRWYLSGTAVTLVAATAKQELGFAMLGQSIQDRAFSRIYELLAIAVAPEWHRQGVADLLIREISAIAMTLNAGTLTLHTSADNYAAQQLFKKHGFEAAKTKPVFYPEGQDAIMMVKHFF